jgi:tetratricopeptide (TPR) repeat protein
MPKPSEKHNSAPTLEVLLAFIFGVIFCAILAYAGLRKEPITDPGQFFILRVLAGISAAGVAAVIPGMLNFQMGQGKLFIVRGAGALAVFAIIYLVNPPELIRPAGEAKRAAMEGNYAQGLYRDADRTADEILKDNPNDAEALNIKGGIAFYDGNFDSAVEYFRKAHENAPKSAIITSNYANALIETKGYDLAIELFKSIDDGKRDRSFTLGRAYLYAGNLKDAHALLQTVPATYWRGAGKILDAAVLTKLANSEDLDARKKFETQAREEFREGYLVDRSYWDSIFSRGQTDPHLSYTLPVKLLTAVYKEEAGRR